jgi:hypothetical protein
VGELGQRNRGIGNPAGTARVSAQRGFCERVRSPELGEMRRYAPALGWYVPIPRWYAPGSRGSCGFGALAPCPAIPRAPELTTDWQTIEAAHRRYARPYKHAVPIDKTIDILGYEVKDGHLGPDLVALFVAARVWEQRPTPGPVVVARRGDDA